jgi:phosphoglucosamine mutase
MTQRLFGTDGIRGRAYEPPLDEATVRRLGVSLARRIQTAPNGAPRFLLAGDTRRSTPSLAEWLADGIRSAGGRVTWGGVLPTPAVSRLLGDGAWDAGVVISASHNPAADNGIKVLGPGGEKISRTIERRLEADLPAGPGGPGLPLAPRERGLTRRYRDLLLASLPDAAALSGLRIVVDAAHGAASGLAEGVLAAFGAEVVAIASEPDGDNINAGVGATATDALAAAVTAQGADGGLALDGDADRAILVDEHGGILDGDDILLVWARGLATGGRLPDGRVVATVMSNLGLELALRAEGMAMIRCPVGDRSVHEAMVEHGAVLGGEQSGHVICSHFGVTGDGILTGLQVLALATASGRRLSELSGLERLPQILLNVPVGRRRAFVELPQVRRTVTAAEDQLGDRGRVVLRYSGTEPLARVMLEGEDEAEITALAEAIAEALRQALPV